MKSLNQIFDFYFYDIIRSNKFWLFFHNIYQLNIFPFFFHDSFWPNTLMLSTASFNPTLIRWSYKYATGIWKQVSHVPSVAKLPDPECSWLKASVSKQTKPADCSQRSVWQKDSRGLQSISARLPTRYSRPVGPVGPRSLAQTSESWVVELVRRPSVRDERFGGGGI